MVPCTIPASSKSVVKESQGQCGWSLFLLIKVTLHGDKPADAV